MLSTCNEPSLKCSPEDNLHVTLVFLGQVAADIEAQLLQMAGQIQRPSFSVNFKALEHWPRPKVLCLTAADPPDAMQQLVDDLSKIASRCAIEIEDRPYRPHITLARKAGRLVSCPVPEFHWRAESFALYVSESTENGPIYSVINRWPLTVDVQDTI